LLSSTHLRSPPKDHWNSHWLFSPRTWHRLPPILSPVEKASHRLALLVSDLFLKIWINCILWQVGYPVDPDARQNLITDYNRVLK
jgi:hypothetical protein